MKQKQFPRRFASSFFLSLSLLLFFSTETIIIIAQQQMANNVTVLKNANIYTVDETNPRAQAVAIDQDTGLILAVGSNDEIAARFPVRSITYDMGGRLVLPGFHDAHLHAVEAGINQGLCAIEGQTPIQDVPSIFANCSKGGQFADQGWIVGAGIDVSTLLEIIDTDPNAEYPITALDRSFPTIPVLILDRLGHGAVANSVAMQAVGYHELQGNPPGGIIIRDETTGELTGIVLENAQQRLREMAFPPSEANNQMAFDSLLAALDVFAVNGITTVSDAGGFWRQAQIGAWNRAENEGLLSVRASNALYIYPDEPFDIQLPRLLERYSNDSSRLTRFNQAKIYVDGILSLSTGALYDPYDRELAPEFSRGLEYFTGASKNLTEISQILSSNGFQLHFHVTGDRGAGLALDAIAASDPSSGPHRLTHCFLVDERDRARLVSMGAVADFQLAPSSVSQANMDFISDIIGPARTSRLLPAVELYENEGASLIISSDYDADEISPLVKIQTMLTRTTGLQFPDVETVIPLMTRDSAAFLKTNTGSIQVGKLADLIALDNDIFNMPVDTIGQAQVVMTMFNGEIIYDPLNIGVVFASQRPDFSVVCFSGDNIVIVQDGRRILMKELKVGDSVLVESSKQQLVFERVYSFGHWDDKLEATFLQIYIQGSDRPLEISHAHMLFLENGNAVPASLVKVGDIVQMAQQQKGTVKEIKTVVRKGVYAPFTSSGTIIVSGVKASTYIALQNSQRLQITDHQVVPFLTHQWLAHTAVMPLRIYCSVRLCTPTSAGISKWVQRPLELATWWLKQDTIVLCCFFSVFLCVLFFFALLEQMLVLFQCPLMMMMMMLLGVIGFLGCWAGKRKRTAQ